MKRFGKSAICVLLAASALLLCFPTPKAKAVVLVDDMALLYYYSLITLGTGMSFETVGDFQKAIEGVSISNETSISKKVLYSEKQSKYVSQYKTMFWSELESRYIYLDEPLVWSENEGRYIDYTGDIPKDTLDAFNKDYGYIDGLIQDGAMTVPTGGVAYTDAKGNEIPITIPSAYTGSFTTSAGEYFPYKDYHENGVTIELANYTYRYSCELLDPGPYPDKSQNYLHSVEVTNKNTNVKNTYGVQLVGYEGEKWELGFVHVYTQEGSYYIDAIRRSGGRAGSVSLNPKLTNLRNMAIPVTRLTEAPAKTSIPVKSTNTFDPISVMNEMWRKLAEENTPVDVVALGLKSALTATKEEDLNKPFVITQEMILDALGIDPADLVLKEPGTGGDDDTTDDIMRKLLELQALLNALTASAGLHDTGTRKELDDLKKGVAVLLAAVGEVEEGQDQVWGGIGAVLGGIGEINEKLRDIQLGQTGIKTGVTDMAKTIAETKTLVEEMKGVLVAEGALALPSTTGWPSLTGVFPFSIPWDIAALIGAFNATAEAPVFRFEFPASIFKGGGEVVWEMSEFETLAEIVRWIIFIMFLWGLLILTRKVTQW